MANQEHISLAQYLKDVHSNLRVLTANKGAEVAWKEHCNKKDILKTYAKTMEKLATTHWESNCVDVTSEATSRIEWAVNFIYMYFINNLWKNYRDKEFIINSKLNGSLIEYTENFSNPIKLIDVGSCYNPFKQYDNLDVTAIDLCPANSSVLECDFLSVEVGYKNIIENNKVSCLEEQSFDVVTFCFLLEYIPSSDLRIKACKNAYNILKPGGLLIISTPDSKHVGANSNLMKCWRYTLAHIGFNRIKYEKHRYMHCMVFRKTLCRDVAVRWATLHKQPYMSFAINIPQDFQKIKENIESEKRNKIELINCVEDFHEMPFSDDNNL